MQRKINQKNNYSQCKFKKTILKLLYINFY